MATRIRKRRMIHEKVNDVNVMATRVVMIMWRRYSKYNELFCTKEKVARLVEMIYPEEDS
jgi:hypothetical protein